MTRIKADQIKKLRAKTKAGVMDCRRALEESSGDLKKAEAWLRKKGIESASKREGRETKQGLIEVYLHNDGKIAGLVELLCETDFVARTDEFKKLAHELAMQAAAMKPKNLKEFLKQAWIRDEKKTIDSLIKELISKTGENIVVNRVARFELGE
ncbi:translation elongation factor Ts [Microgenomates group bacterium RBG_19FT_COMBO_39_10]|nr:MAG: translation elongation factor Ts [Microgenomates group bacterium RBG_19FT_COMBO_39_10]